MYGTLLGYILSTILVQRYDNIYIAQTFLTIN